MAEASYSKEHRPDLGSDGMGLASVLSELALNDPETFSQIKDSLRSVIPTVKDVRFERVELPVYEQKPQVKIPYNSFDDDEVNMVVRRYWGHRLVFDMVGAKQISALQVSEGTLLVLGLLTVLFRSPRPNLILLDNIDLSLHPRAQKDALKLLRSIMSQYPSLQILATTHSPYLLDELVPEEIRVTTLDSQGIARCAGLSDSPEFEKWKNEMTPGEIWSVLGESWVASQKMQGRKA